MIPYILALRGYILRSKDRHPLVGRELVRELNILHSQVAALRKELASSVGGLTPDQDALRSLDSQHDEDDQPVAAVASKPGSGRPQTLRTKNK